MRSPPGSGAKHPLMVATWSSVAADLRQPGWVEALVAAGFDAARPTVWAAEGLLMYLPEDAVRQLLTTARAISAPGSRATFSMVNDAAVCPAPPPYPAAALTGKCLENQPWIRCAACMDVHITLRYSLLY